MEKYEDRTTAFFISFFHILFTYFSTVLQTLSTSIFDIIKGVYNVIVKIVKGIYKTLKAIYNVLNKYIFNFIPFFYAIKPTIQILWGNAVKLFRDTFDPILNSSITKYFIAFLVYIIAVVFMLTPKTSTPVSTEPNKMLEGSATWEFLKKLDYYLNPFGWLKYFGRILFIILYGIVFGIIYFYIIMKDGKTWDVISQRLQGNAVFYFLLFIFCFFGYLIAESGALKLFILFLSFVVFFWSELGTIFSNSWKNMSQMFTKFYHRPDLDVMSNETAVRGVSSTIMESVNSFIMYLYRFIQPIFDLIQFIIDELKKHFSKVLDFGVYDKIFLFFTSFAYFIFLYYAYYNFESTNLYLYIIPLIVCFMVPTLMRLFDKLKSFGLLSVIITSILIVYITNTSMDRNEVFQSTTSQKSDKNIYNTVMMIYSAIIVFFINIQVLAPGFKPEYTKLVFIIHILFIIVLMYFAISYKSKLRNRIEQSVDPTADLTFTNEPPITVTGNGFGMPPPASPNTVTTIDNTSPHVQMYRK